MSAIDPLRTSNLRLTSIDVCSETQVLHDNRLQDIRCGALVILRAAAKDKAKMKTFSILALCPASFALLLSCAGGSRSDLPMSLSSADKVLLAFGARENCQLWTNWQKLCSRDPEGNPQCVVDADRPVAGSAPFCADYNTFSSAMDDTPQENASKARFCERIETTQLVNGSGLPSSKIKVCRQFRKDRPFNGRDLEQMRSPLCSDWRRGGKGAWQCASWTNVTCKPMDGSGRTEGHEEDEIVIDSAIDPDRTPVIAVTCTIRRPQNALN